jgi:lipopolysaccharide transport system permease protein
MGRRTEVTTGYAEEQTARPVPDRAPRQPDAQAPRLRRDDLVYLRDATLHLAGRQIAARYRRSLLGGLWSLGPPLAQLVVFQFVFTRVIPLDIPNFALFLLTGILVWSFFSQGVSVATGSLETNRHLLRQPSFPAALVPLVAVVVALIDYLVALPILLLAAAFTVGIGPAAAFLPVILAIQLTFTVGLGWIFAVAQVFFRDIQHLVGLLLMLGFWLTPIFYARSSVPDRFDIVYQLNPLAHLVSAQREVVLEGRLPALLPLALVGLAGAVLCAIGLAVFARFRSVLSEEL